MATISLTTDFGIRNGFVGVLKGVIYKIAPETKIADISHTIAAQDIHEGAFALWRAYSFFPNKTVHVFVVDPGVGTQRRPLAAEIGMADNPTVSSNEHVDAFFGFDSHIAVCPGV